MSKYLHIGAILSTIGLTILMSVEGNFYAAALSFILFLSYLADSLTDTVEERIIMTEEELHQTIEQKVDQIIKDSTRNNN